ncbi:MAG: transaldolase [Sulfurovum sp.]|nr:transaldolase [Sulfurovum sp.]MCB4744420.1 transaldolase [Sulfurovum sp.]MCB4745880.1 transaldolase [Sulfurovum sp.]MCB4748947.1 transaldolase [Sulfurovum sp.]MCB4749884.1 transaldolase [Sulfurovum sp.]
MVNKEIDFSLWLDFVERDYLKNQFNKLIEKGIINGATSNPAIFASAITTSPAYKAQLASLEGRSSKEKYEALAIEDIRMAAQALRPLYDMDNDGYISIEVDPFLSNNTQGTIEEGKRLFKAIGEPNVMIKVPATNAGYEAMTILLSEGISVNATLVFSPLQAQRCVKAMEKGMEQTDKKIDGVISVFVSRFDRMLDSDLMQNGIDVGLTGIYNAAKIYNLIEKNSNMHIRTLFASTGVKGDDLPPYYYMRELLASHAVNTAPLATIESWIAVKKVLPKLPLEDTVINGYFTKLSDNGFDMEMVYATLLKEGLEAFEKAFQEMLDILQ